MRLSKRRIVHWDFHYAEVVLFSSCRLRYYITLSLHCFQRLPFLTIKLSRIWRTFRAWTLLTLLLWSHAHSHTHLFACSNLDISCGCPALSIWASILIYASHSWCIELLSHFPSPGLTSVAPFIPPAGEQAVPPQCLLPLQDRDGGGGSMPCLLCVK